MITGYQQYKDTGGDKPLSGFFGLVRENSRNDNKEAIQVVLEGIDFIKYHCIIPVVIFDESTKIYRAKLDTEFKVQEIIDIELGLWKFVSDIRIPNCFDKYIFLCNLYGFKKLLTLLDEYLSGTMDYHKKTTKEFPLTIFGDISPS